MIPEIDHVILTTYGPKGAAKKLSFGDNKETNRPNQTYAVNTT